MSRCPLHSEQLAAVPERLLLALRLRRWQKTLAPRADGASLPPPPARDYATNESLREGGVSAPPVGLWGVQAVVGTSEGGGEAPGVAYLPRGPTRLEKLKRRGRALY